MPKPMNITQKKSHISQSDYEEGKTALNTEQLALFSCISEELHDNYFSFLNLYSPKGLISLLLMQLETKRIDESVPQRNIERAERDICLLAHSFDFSNKQN